MPQLVGVFGIGDVTLGYVIVGRDTVECRIVLVSLVAVEIRLAVDKVLVEVVLDLGIQFLGVRRDLLPVGVLFIRNLPNVFLGFQLGGNILHLGPIL